MQKGKVMRVLFYGAGAVGLAFSASLISAGFDVSFYARASTALNLMLEGIHITGVLGKKKVESTKFKVLNSIELVLREKFDVIVLCTKLTEIESLVKEFMQVYDANPEAKVVLLQNGWGINRLFKGKIADQNLFNAFIHLGINRPKLHCADITAVGGPSAFGNITHRTVDPTVEKLCQGIQAGGVPCEYSSDIGSLIWSKMLYNCTTNPLSFIMSSKNGELVRTSYSQELIASLVVEIFAVIKALGYAVPWSTPEEYTEVLIKQLIPYSSEHVSSMQQDRINKRVTEVDFLNGAVVAVAKEKGLPAVANTLIYNLVKSIEAFYLSKEKDKKEA